MSSNFIVGSCTKMRMLGSTDRDKSRPYGIAPWRSVTFFYNASFAKQNVAKAMLHNNEKDAGKHG